LSLNASASANILSIDRSIVRSFDRDDDGRERRERSNVDRRRTVVEPSPPVTPDAPTRTPTRTRAFGVRTSRWTTTFERSRWTFARFTYNDGFHAMND